MRNQISEHCKTTVIEKLYSVKRYAGTTEYLNNQANYSFVIGFEFSKLDGFTHELLCSENLPMHSVIRTCEQ